MIYNLLTFKKRDMYESTEDGVGRETDVDTLRLNNNHFLLTLKSLLESTFPIGVVGGKYEDSDRKRV